MNDVDPSERTADGTTADSVAAHAPRAIAHLNADHADALLLIAQTLGGRPDTRSARASAIDREGLELELETPTGQARTHVRFAAPLDSAAELRAASVELTERARAAQASPSASE